MATLIILGLGAGFVSALLFGTIAAGAPAAIVLCYLAPLPVFIVCLGWHRRLGLLAAFAGASAIAIAIRPAAGTAFLLGPALPAWALGSLCLVGRRIALADGRIATLWLAPGPVLLGAGLAGAFVAVAAAAGLGRGDPALFEATLRRATQLILRTEFGNAGARALPSVAGVPGPGLVGLLVAIAPAIAAAAFGFALAVNLWLGAKAVSLSGRLPRPWPPLSETRMPLAALGLVAAGLVLGLLSGWPAIAGRAVAGGIGMMFALQGLALLHAATRGRAGRAPILVVTYGLTLFFGGTVLPLLAVAGMIDTATPLRRRVVPAPPSPPPHP